MNLVASLKTKPVLVLLFLHIALFILNGVPFVLGDGFGYFHIAKSLVDQGGFVSATEPSYYEYSAHGVAKQDGKFLTAYSPGSSLLMTPSLLLSKLLDQEGVQNDYYKTFNGHSLGDGLAVLLSATVASFLALLLLFNLGKHLKISSRASLLLSISVYLSFFLLTYTFELPAFSHIYEFLFATLIVYLFVAKPPKYFLGMGIAFGILVAVRPTNIVFASFFLPLILSFKWKSLSVAILGSLPGIILWCIYNLQSFGTPIASGYSKLWNQNFDLSRFNLLPILFSDVRGLIIYTPIVLLGIFGLWQYRHKFYFYIPVIFTVIIYSFWPIWWAGESLGNRFFISIAPIIFVGVVTIWQKHPKIVSKVVLACALYAALLTILWRITPIEKVNPNRDDGYGISANENYSPQTIFKYHVDSVGKLGVLGYLKSLPNNLHGGRSIAMLALGLSEPLVKVESLSASDFKVVVTSDNLGRMSPFKIALVNPNETSFIEIYTPQSLKIVCNDYCLFDGYIAPGKETALNQSIELGNTGSKLLLPDSVNLINRKLKE